MLLCKDAIKLVVLVHDEEYYAWSMERIAMLNYNSSLDN